MQVIGVTGGIGSGKSVVSDIIRVLGYPVFNSDTEAKNILEGSKEVHQELNKVFGPDIFQNKKIDRKKIAEIVFNDESKLKSLNQIIHPRVKTRFNEWKQKQNTPMVFKEAAILIESGSYKDCDKIVVITAPLELRINRVKKRDNINEDLIKSRMKNQFPEEELKSKADFIIKNDESQPLTSQVLRILEELKKLC